MQEEGQGSTLRSQFLIRYPRRHFCQQAMECQDTSLVGDLAWERFPAPGAQGAAAAWEVG